MANTPFLDLVKPAGTDHALVSVINSNSDKIDTGVSTLSEQIGIYEFGTKTLSEFESALNTYVNNNMSNGQTKSISVSISPASSPFGANLYMGDVKKLNSTRTRVELRRATSIDTVTGAANNGAWTWEVLATKSEVVSDWTVCADYKSAAESSASALLMSFGKQRTLSFQGVARTHAEGDVIMTLPAEHRPISGSPFGIGSIGTTPVVCRLNNSDGKLTIYLINGATSSARLYLSMSWVVA